MEPLQTLYNLLGINRKIENDLERYLYLKDFWGMEQSLIGKCEGVSQSYVSKMLIKARETVSRETLAKLEDDLYTPEEVQYIQYLPREVLPDIPAIAFINNILKVYPQHGFFSYLDTALNSRIVGLAWLGVQNKHICKLFNKNQPTVSMIVKRSLEKMPAIIRPARYEHVDEYRLLPKPKKYNNFTLAGGQEL